MDFVSTIVTSLSVLTVVGQVIVIAIALMLFLRKPAKLLSWISAHGLVLMLVVALLGTMGSLFLSEVAGWAPCKLCWFQRIFLYPQVVLLVIAVWRRDRSVALPILALSIIGMLIAAEHYSEQIYTALHPVTADGLKPCDDTGVSCARAPFFHFGYITIPLMALTAFALNSMGSLVLLRRKH